MIRFVDMRQAQIAGVRFGYWDTVRDRMVKIDDEQAWEVFDELEADIEADIEVPSSLVERLRGVTPEWAFKVPE